MVPHFANPTSTIWTVVSLYHYLRVATIITSYRFHHASPWLQYTQQPGQHSFIGWSHPARLGSSIMVPSVCSLDLVYKRVYYARAHHIDRNGETVPYPLLLPLSLSTSTPYSKSCLFIKSLSSLLNAASVSLCFFSFCASCCSPCLRFNFRPSLIP